MFNKVYTQSCRSYKSCVAVGVYIALLWYGILIFTVNTQREIYLHTKNGLFEGVSPYNETEVNLTLTIGTYFSWAGTASANIGTIRIDASITVNWHIIYTVSQSG